MICCPWTTFEFWNCHLGSDFITPCSYIYIETMGSKEQICKTTKPEPTGGCWGGWGGKGTGNNTFKVTGQFLFCSYWTEGGCVEGRNSRWSRPRFIECLLINPVSDWTSGHGSLCREGFMTFIKETDRKGKRTEPGLMSSSCGGRIPPCFVETRHIL